MVVVLGEADHPLPLDQGGHGADGRVVPVEHGDTVWREPLHQLGLGHGDGLATAELAQVGDADVEHDRDVRGRDGAERPSQCEGSPGGFADARPQPPAITA